MKNKYFIPEIITIKGIPVPSTPFNSNGKAIFLGDVIEVVFEDNEKDTLVVDLAHGQYIAHGSDPESWTPLWILADLPLKVLGSSIANPDLLKRLNP